MPLTRYMTLLAIVLAAAGVTVLAAQALAPGMPDGAGRWAGLAAILAAAALLVARRT